MITEDMEGFVKSIADLAIAAEKTEILEILDRKYTVKALTPVKDPEPFALEVGTLTAIKDYLTSNPDGLPMATTIVIVDNPDNVRVLSCLTGVFEQRPCYLKAVRPRFSYKFGEYQNVEQFIIFLQAQFVLTDMITTLLKIVGNITEGAVRTHLDDGVSQTVTAKAGITKVENIPVPSPVILAPFRTFIDVPQPESKFILRMRSGEQTPACALFEADGGAWQLEAVMNIKEWLMENLPKEVTILA
jgi:hypothetical protein